MAESYPVLLRDLPGPDEASAAAVAVRAAEILRPSGALKRFDEVAAWLAGWQRTARPHVDSVATIVFVGDHGVTTRGVSAYPQAITAEMLRALTSGAATAAVMTAELGGTLRVVDVGVGDPTGDITIEDAMDEARFEACFEAGRAAVREIDCDLLVLGEMGIGNTTAAAAVGAALYGLRPDDWAGRGTGVDDEGLRRKIDAVEAARRRVEGSDPLEILRRAGGCELVALVGAALEARIRLTPIVLDGFVVTAALSALAVAAPGALDHCIAGHRSSEPGHRLLLEKLGLEPLLDLDLRLGEGSGALAAVPLVRLAVACVNDVATFSEWGIGD